MRISVELVPRNADQLAAEVTQIKSALPSVNAINIPDLTRLSIRSWDACEMTQPHYAASIPHIRANDIDPAQPLPMRHLFTNGTLNEVLVVSGDLRPGETDYRFKSMGLIQKFKQELPHVKVYAALDPYRQSFAAEVAYAEEKLAAGADGLFTQPFFDIKLMEIYADLLPNVEIFWGIAPVSTERSHQYWLNQNQAIFPAVFEPTLSSSRRFAKHALDFAKRRNGNVYFMPIKVDPVQYLGGIL